MPYAKWLSMWTHNTGIVSWIPPCVTFKTPLVMKAMGNHLMNSTSLENTQSPVSGFCYARNRVWSVVNLKRCTSLENTQSPVSGFCYARNRVWSVVNLKRCTSLENTQSPVSGFCYARNRVCNAATCLRKIR